MKMGNSSTFYLFTKSPNPYRITSKTTIKHPNPSIRRQISFNHQRYPKPNEFEDEPNLKSRFQRTHQKRKPTTRLQHHRNKQIPLHFQSCGRELPAVLTYRPIQPDQQDWARNNHESRSNEHSKIDQGDIDVQGITEGGWLLGEELRKAWFFSG
jgi:ribosomal protein L34E